MDKLPKSYRDMNRKNLKKWLLFQMNQNITLLAENCGLNKALDDTEQHLRSAENALDYKEKVISKYKKLLEVSVEDL